MHSQASKYYAVDVECVATGVDHNARGVAQVAIVDEYMNLLLVRVMGKVLKAQPQRAQPTSPPLRHGTVHS